MPLLNHFVPPLSRTHPWRSFCSAWAAGIAGHLNRGVLPAGYYAVPNVELDGPVEIDIATLRELQAETQESADLSFWTPPEPGLVCTLDFPALDLVEVQVLFEEDRPELMAAIELVSPSNKDRPAERRAFAIKCLSYLHQGSSLVVIDPVTTRHANLHAAIMGLLELENGAVWKSPTNLYTAAYRAVGADEQRQLQVWPEVLELGGLLPRLPLWLGVDVCVPLDLETTYQTTCDDLRIRQAS